MTDKIDTPWKTDGERSFAWALQQMQSGRRVTRDSMSHGGFHFMVYGTIFTALVDDLGNVIVTEQTRISNWDIFAEDWMVVEEKKVRRIE